MSSKKQNKATPLPAVLPRRLDVALAATYLGTTKWRIRSLVWEEKLHGYIDGQRLLFDVKDLDAYADSLRGAA
jgi:hypothetical protein